MDEKPPNARSLAQQRVQARRLLWRSCGEAGVVVFLVAAMYFMIRDGLHIVLKLICGLILASTALHAVTDFLAYKKRRQTLRELETQS